MAFATNRNGGDVSRILCSLGGLVLGAAAMSVAGASPQDPVAVSPQYYAVRLVNERVRVLEYRLKPGEKEGTHTHPPGLVYVLDDSTLRSTLPDGAASERPSKRGELFWREQTTHAAENTGRTDAHALVIDVKPCGA